MTTREGAQTQAERLARNTGRAYVVTKLVSGDHFARPFRQGDDRQNGLHKVVDGEVILIVNPPGGIR